jgi:hypothetical protein
MEQSSLSGEEGYLNDGVYFASSRSRHIIDTALARSPRRFLGDELIRDLAAKLEQQRKKDRKVITPGRLTLALRNVVNMAVDYTNGSTATVDTTVGIFEQSPNQKTVPAANAGTAKHARKKLASAKELVDQLVELLNADEIAAFCTPNVEVLSSVHAELTRLKASVRVPTGLTRGRPALLHLVQLVHAVLYQLTGTWLRFREDDERGDRFIVDALNRICKPLIGTEFSDEDLGRTIETAIRSPKNRQRSGA